jgi:predicted nucleic acid-binding protein
MKYPLDSNTLSDCYDKFSDGYLKIHAKLSSLTNNDKVYISILILYELEFNAPSEKKEAIRKMIREAQKDFDVLPLKQKGSQLFGLIKKRIKDSRMINKENIKKHNIDIIIAVTAIVENQILVSSDSIYLEIKQLDHNLKIEDWFK